MRSDAYLQFRSRKDRVVFLHDLRREAPDLAEKLHAAKAQPLLVGRGLEEDEYVSLARRVRGKGRIFRDTRLGPLT